jgi:hypothetical protein
MHRRQGRRQVQTRWQTLVEKRAKRGLEFIAEQRLFAEGDRSQIPLEYRAYTFLDEVRLIQQVDRNVNPPEEVFYVNEFEAVADGTKIESSWKAIKRGTPQVPRCADDILRFAKRLHTYKSFGD